MKRLLESHDPNDGAERQLASLLGVLSPTTPEPFRKERIRAQLGLRLFGSSQLGSFHRWRWVLVGSVIVFGSVAAAMVGRSNASRQPMVASVATSQALAAASSANSKQPPFVQEDVPASEPIPTSPNVNGKPLARTASTAGEDPSLVAQAIQALRNDHEPARARRLLDRYLKANPHGALAEEALTLSIEASNALGDPRAANLGCKYLATYPSGRHRALASRACEKAQAAK